MKVNDITLMNAPNVETAKNGVKYVVPNNIENFETYANDKNVVIDPVQSATLRDSKINRERYNKIAKALANKAVIAKTPEDRVPQRIVKNMYTTPVNESKKRSLNKKHTLQEFADFHNKNSRHISESMRYLLREEEEVNAAELYPDISRSSVDDEKTVYNLIIKRMFWDPNTAIPEYKNFLLGSPKVSAINRRNNTDANFTYNITKKDPDGANKPNADTRYPQNSQIAGVSMFKMDDYDIGVLVPSVEDGELARRIASTLRLRCDEYKLTPEQKKTYKVVDSASDDDTTQGVVDTDIYAYIIRVPEEIGDMNYADYIEDNEINVDPALIKSGHRKIAQ